MYSNPLVSVVLTTYNVSDFIKETIFSVLNQSYKNIEIVIIDDGSTDDTKKFLYEFLKLENVKIEFRDHTGNIGKNLNDCIKLSTGDLIAVLGADDVFEKQKTEIQVDYLRLNSVVCSNKKIIDQNSNIISYGDNTKERYLGLSDLLFRNDILASSVMLHKHVLENCGMFDEEVGNRSEDYSLWLRISEKYKIKYINKSLVRYRIHDKNLSNKTFDDYKILLNRNIQLISKYLNHENKTIVMSAKKGIAAIYIRIAKRLFLKKYFHESLSYVRLSFDIYKGNLSKFFIKRLFFFILVRYKTLVKSENIGFYKKYITDW